MFRPHALSAPGQVDDYYRAVTGSADGREGPSKLYFAGEAFSRDFSGYTHGAYQSGEEVAT